MTLNISQKEIQQFQDIRPVLLLDYEVQEYELQECKRLHASNTNAADVKEKVHLLNKYYSTRVPLEKMADHISKISKIESRLKQGDLSLVMEIATLNGKVYYSFATKYCALHEPEKFPIWDNEVWNFFIYLNQQGLFDSKVSSLFSGIKNPKTGNYADYVTIYDAFMQKTGISKSSINYRQVDYYVWGNITIYKRYNKYKAAIPSLLANIFGGLAAQAIWELLKLFCNQVM